VPIQRFGITMSAMLLAALSANLLLLPALLAGPLGRYLCPRTLAMATGDGPEFSTCELREPLPMESAGAAPAGMMHNPPREGRAATMVRRDGSHGGRT
jgi:hypothetical protein